MAGDNSEISNAQDVETRLEAILARLNRLALVLTGDETQAGQLVQSTCRRFMGAPGQLPEGEDFEHLALADINAVWTWEVRAGNIAKSPLGSPALLNTALFGLNGNDGQNQSLNRVGKYLQRMPPQQRAALLLIYGEGYSYHEAAQLLDLSIDVVTAAVVGARSSLIDTGDIPLPETDIAELETTNFPSLDTAHIAEKLDPGRIDQ